MVMAVIVQPEESVMVMVTVVIVQPEELVMVMVMADPGKVETNQGTLLQNVSPSKSSNHILQPEKKERDFINKHLVLE